MWLVRRRPWRLLLLLVVVKFEDFDETRVEALHLWGDVRMGKENELGGGFFAMKNGPN